MKGRAGKEEKGGRGVGGKGESEGLLSGAALTRDIPAP